MSITAGSWISAIVRLAATPRALNQVHLVHQPYDLGPAALGLAPGEAGRPWPKRRADYVAHYRVLLDEAFDPQVLAERGAALQALARPGLETDPNRLFTLELFERNLQEEVRPGINMGPGGKSPGVVGFATERSEWLRSLLARGNPGTGARIQGDIPRAG